MDMIVPAISAWSSEHAISHPKLVWRFVPLKEVVPFDCAKDVLFSEAMKSKSFFYVSHPAIGFTTDLMYSFPKKHGLKDSK